MQLVVRVTLFLFADFHIFPSLLGDGCPFVNIRSDKTLFTAVWVYLLLGGSFYLANAVFLFLPDKKDMIPRFVENQSS